ncbi:MAG TPA: hypothetical protein PKZ08_15235 [Vicinamibacterales bacterium]|nr:hypothetical protein [Vicinamibacterales bacterium]
MPSYPLIKEVKLVRFLNTLVTAGVDGAAVDSAAIDCRGFDRILVTLDVGATATKNGTLKFLLVDCDTSGGTYAAITGATIGTHTFGASGEAKKTHVIDCAVVPTRPFIKVRYQRETQNSTIDNGYYLLYNGKRLPEAQPTDIKNQVVV